MNTTVTNVVIAGLGGQGVIKAAGIIADTAYRAGLDVKQSELHGMSQRGGSVSSDIRFGAEVLSPMVPAGGADFLVVAAPDQVDVNRPQLRQGGMLIAPSDVDEKQLPNKKSLNIALLGVLSRQLPIAERHWREAISAAFPEKLQAANDQAFTLGRSRAIPAHPVVPHPVSAPDFMSIPELRATQLARLRQIVARAYDRVKLFRQRMDERGLLPADIQSLADLQRLPFTVKMDLRDTYPYGLFASPMRDVVRLHASSGTTGKPIVVAYTQDDVDVWASVMLRTFAACGLHAGDIIQNAYGYGLFTGGLGAHYGAEALGATVIPISGGNTERQLMVMKDFGVTAICCTPSYFLHLLDQAQSLGINVKDLPLRVGVFGAEPWTENMRERIEAGSRIKAYDIYGLSEIIGPGVASECSAQCGLHIFEDQFLPEIINPQTLEPVADGVEGELVLTTLSKQAMPMIRYRTRDITSFITAPCPCGRTIRRIQRIGRRSDDMVIIRGVNVFPSQIEAALLRVEGTLPHYQLVLTRVADLDQLEVQVEVTENVLSDEIRGLEELQKKLVHSIEIITGVRVAVRLVAPKTIQRSEGKAKRVIDQRAL